MYDEETKHKAAIEGCKAAKRWFYSTFDDDLLKQMEKYKLIDQAEGFSISTIAELQLHIEEAIFNMQPN